MVLDWIGGLGAWTWIILGVVLIGLELVAPGAFLLWLGLAAILTGLIDGWAALSWQIATLTFAGLSVVSVLVGRGVNRAPLTGEAATLNRAGKGLRAGCSPWRRRSSPARVACGSTTAPGGSSAPTRRPARGCA
jgi:hypothetical protein